MTDHDADLDAILDQLEAADLVEQYTDDGRPRCASRRRAQLGRSMALAGEDDVGAVLDALLDELLGQSGVT